MEKTIQYQNGCLAYAEYGNPQGFPVLIQHGMIASISDSQLFHRLIESGARLILPARPGYGRASAFIMKNIAEWGEIIAVLADELQLARFDVFGISSGAPYSYALGHRFPDRVRNLFILSGTPALYAPDVQSVWPYPLDPSARLEDLQTLVHQLFFSDLSEEEMGRADIRDSMMNNCFGPALDLQIRCRDWGFKLSGVLGRVIMRHSRADGFVPLAAAELTARLLPDCRLVIRETDAHFSKQVLDDFIDKVMLPTLI